MKKTVLIVTIVILAGIGSIITFHYYFLDGVVGVLGSVLFENDTVYSSGYSDKAFRRIKQGMSKQEVLNILGIPLGESWYYKNTGNERFRIWFVDDIVSYVYIYHSDTKSSHIQKGMEKASVLNMLGNPTEKSWIYSKSPGDKSYKVRAIILKDDKVTKKIHEFYVD